MALPLNIRHLERDALELRGELELEELDLSTMDEMIQPALPLTYVLHVEMLQKAVLVQGTLEITFDCQCVRCLKPFRHRLKLRDWACHLALEGDEAEPVANDLVDLTPHVREDIFLALPQHPVCDPECDDLPMTSRLAAEPPGLTSPFAEGSSAWGELNKLKLD
jgi:uncharacterized metal-binding protein YceD (DUF177 family)